MKQELLDKEVLCIYDIRAIQNFIFKSTRNTDILGGDRIVKTILQEALKSALGDKSLGLKDDEYSLEEWGNAEYMPYFDDERVKAQIITVAGGNAFMLYRTGRLCQAASRAFSRYLLKNTHTLEVAICAVEKTDNIHNDFNNLYLELDKVKSSDQSAQPLGAFPIVKKEEITGNAISMFDSETGEEISTETYLKRRKIKSSDTDLDSFDFCEDLKAYNKNIAYIHIDGNSMGLTIAKIMGKLKDYEKGVLARRLLNINFQDNYVKVLTETEEWFYDVLKSEGVPADYYRYFYRRIHIGGDDINLVIASKYALKFTEHFINEVSKRYVWSDDLVGTVYFSVCAGIGFVSADTSFKEGIPLAKECCDTAKLEAKKPENLIDDKVGNWIDYQINQDRLINSVTNVRDDSYVSLEGDSLCLRPYCLDKAREGTPTYYGNLKLYHNVLKQLIKSDKVLRGMIVAYSGERQDFMRALNTYKMMGGKLPAEVGQPFVEIEGRDVACATWYDAVELVMFGI